MSSNQWFVCGKLSGGCSSVGVASDRHATDAGSIPRCGKGFFSQSRLSGQTLLRCPHSSRVQSHALTSVRMLKNSSIGDLTFVWTHEINARTVRNGYHCSGAFCSLTQVRRYEFSVRNKLMGEKKDEEKKNSHGVPRRFSVTHAFYLVSNTPPPPPTALAVGRGWAYNHTFFLLAFQNTFTLAQNM